MNSMLHKLNNSKNICFYTTYRFTELVIIFTDIDKKICIIIAENEDSKTYIDITTFFYKVETKSCFIASKNLNEGNTNLTKSVLTHLPKDMRNEIYFLQCLTTREFFKEGLELFI
jgi:hypothetical protein